MNWHLIYFTEPLRDENSKESKPNLRHLNRRDTDDETPDNDFDRNDDFNDIIDDIDDQYHGKKIHQEEHPHHGNNDNDDNDWNQEEYENEDPEEEDEFDEKDSDAADYEGEGQALTNKDKAENNPKG